jgi:GT2 family glycosyltransferase
MRTSIVVSPRERFSALPASLRSLFATIERDVPVVAVEGATPEPIRAELRQLAEERPYKLVSLPYMIKPNEARNTGIAETTTEYVVLADNDIAYEQGWLKALEAHVEKHNSDAVAPLICIGPPQATTIHHAGGHLHALRKDDRVQLSEQHRLMNEPVSRLSAQEPEIDIHVCEFHCMMVRRSLLDRMGGLDERLITREQMDFALRALALGAKVTFACDAVVTYMAKDDFDKIDLEYHLFRWSDRFVVESMDAFEQTWQVSLDRDRIRFAWTAAHRLRGAATAYRWKRRLLGSERFRSSVVEPLESEILQRELSARAGNSTSIPTPVPADRVSKLLSQLGADTAPAVETAA